MRDVKLAIQLLGIQRDEGQPHAHAEITVRVIIDGQPTHVQGITGQRKNLFCGDTLQVQLLDGEFMQEGGTFDVDRVDIAPDGLPTFYRNTSPSLLSQKAGLADFLRNTFSSTASPDDKATDSIPDGY